MRGEIHQSDSGEYEFFVFNPPPGLQRHPNALCFLFQGNDMYSVHFMDTQKNIDAGIIKRFPGQYDRLSYADGFLWGLDAKARRICKIRVE